MLTGLLILTILIPFKLFFSLWNAILHGLSIDIAVLEPANFGANLINMFKNLYLFDKIFPTGTFIELLITSLNIFIGLAVWNLIVWIYKRVRGS